MDTKKDDEQNWIFHKNDKGGALASAFRQVSVRSRRGKIRPFRPRPDRGFRAPEGHSAGGALAGGAGAEDPTEAPPVGMGCSLACPLDWSYHGARA